MNLTTQDQPAVQQQQQHLQPAERRLYAMPVVDVESTADGYTLYVEMPGVNKSGVEITAENGDLVMVGHRAPQEVTGEPIHRESRPVDFRRVYELDPSIDTSRITAKVEQGVLAVHLPKAASVKPRRITLE
jgi:HSP20 family protein